MDPAVFSNLAPYQEYLLQGSVLEKERDLLLHRLTGLCDTDGHAPERFNDHEMVFVIQGHTAQPVQPVKFRVRRALVHADAPWHLRYVGAPDADSKKKTLVRSCVDVGCTSNVEQFLTEMGFKFDHEFVDKGYLFRKGRMRITVSKISQVPVRGMEKIEKDLKPVTSSCLVELSVSAPHGHDFIQEDIVNFATQLKPLVNLEKLDKIAQDATVASIS